MKRFLKLSISCMLALGLFSCKNSVELMKRHYNNGYYVSHSSGKNKVKNHSSLKQETPEVLAAIPVKMIREEVKTPELTASIQNSPEQARTSLAAHKQATRKNVDEALAVQKKHSASALHRMKHAKNALKGGGGGDDGLTTVIMIILCFLPFLCLIPVWRHDGRKATLNFWITLLLHLTFIGYIIFSLLVYLNIVDIS